MPEFRTLDKDTEFSTTSGNTYQGKYAEKYARFLVGSGTATTGAKPESNAAGGDGSFGSYHEKKAAVGFKDLERGSKENEGTDANDKSLQSACDKAYKANTDKVKKNATATDEFDEEQVGKFCSFNGQKPKTLSELESVENSTDKTYLTSKGNGNKWGTKGKNDLLAIHDSSNVKIWKHLGEIFEKTENRTGFFAGNEKPLKEKCEEAYGKDSSNSAQSTDPTETDLYKWCSLKGSKSS